MRHLILSAICVLCVASSAFSTIIGLFSDTASFAHGMNDIVLAKCETPHDDVASSLGDGLYPVDISVQSVLKGKLPVGMMRVAAIEPMQAGRTYLLASYGGLVDGITFIAADELSVVEIPHGFDFASLKEKSLVEQLNLIFATRKAEIDRQQQDLKEEAELLSRALRKKAA